MGPGAVVGGLVVGWLVVGAVVVVRTVVEVPGVPLVGAAFVGGGSPLLVHPVANAAPRVTITSQRRMYAGRAMPLSLPPSARTSRSDRAEYDTSYRV